MSKRPISRSAPDYKRYILRINIPESKDSCQYCPALRNDSQRDVRYCERTGEILPDYKVFRGAGCPLEEVNKEDLVEFLDRQRSKFEDKQIKEDDYVDRV